MKIHILSLRYTLDKISSALCAHRRAAADDFPDPGSPMELSSPRVAPDLLDAFPQRPSGFLLEVQRGMDGLQQQQGQVPSVSTPRGAPQQQQQQGQVPSGSTPRGAPHGMSVNALGGLVPPTPLPPISVIAGGTEHSPTFPSPPSDSSYIDVYIHVPKDHTSHPTQPCTSDSPFV